MARNPVPSSWSQYSGRFFRSAFAAVSVLALWAATAPAQTTNWTGSVSNLWADPTAPTNWDSGIPTGTSVATFNGAGNNNTSISFGGTTQTTGAIQFVSGASSYVIGNTAGDTLNLATDTNGSGVGSISVTSGVTVAQAINANIMYAAGSTAPLITNASTTAAATLTLGASAGSATLTLQSGSTLTVTPTSPTAIIINDSVQGTNMTVSGGGTTTFNGGVQFNGGTLVPSSTGKTTFNGIISGTSGLTATNYTGTLALNAANTYTGGTMFTGSSSSQPTILLGVSTTGSGPITSGPFGTAAVTFSNQNGPAILVPVGADQTIANTFTLTNGFFVGTGTTAQDPSGPHNLHLTGAMTIGKVITNNLAAGVALIFDGPNNVQVNGGTFQTNASGVGGVTIFNENVTNTTGTLAVQNGATVVFNGSYAPTGAITVKNNGPTGVAALGGTLIVNGTTSTGAINVNATNSLGLGNGGILGGTGTIGGTVTVSSTTVASRGGILYPGPGGTTPGTLNGASTVWDPLGRYSFVYNPNDATTGNSLFHGTGTLDLHNLSATAQFDFNFVPNGSGTPPFQPYTLATFNGGITGAGGATGAQFGDGTNITSLFTISGAPPSMLNGATGYAVVVSGPAGGSQSIQFVPVPEPDHVLFACGVAAAVTGWRRRRSAVRTSAV